MRTTKIEYIVGSGNIYVDLGFDDPDECSAKADLMRKINRVIAMREFTQAKAAKMLSVTQQQVYDLLHGQFIEFSIEQLMGFLKLLDHDVSIIVKTQPSRRSDNGKLEIKL